MKQNRLAIIRLLLKLSALGYRRSNAYGEGKGARIIIAVAGIIFWASLTWLGLLMADQVKSYGMTTANGGSYGATPIGYICGVIPFILFADFMLRLSFLHSNTQYAKPFLLLPIPRYACADVFVIKSILQPLQSSLDGTILCLCAHGNRARGCNGSDTDNRYFTGGHSVEQSLVHYCSHPYYG